MPPSPDDPGPAGSLPADYFEELYGRATDGDPWQFRRSPYEAAKYTATLDELPRRRYGSALEVGCSIGIFTRQLAARVADLLAIDIAPTALAQAGLECRDQPHVRFALLDLLVAIPPGPFDLIVLAEVAYYWTPADFERVFPDLVAALGPRGQLILVHWRDAVPDYPQTGDEVHARALTWAGSTGLTHLGRRVEPKYRVDLWERPDGIKPGRLPEPSDPCPQPVDRLVDRDEVAGRPPGPPRQLPGDRREPPPEGRFAPHDPGQGRGIAPELVGQRSDLVPVGLPARGCSGGLLLEAATEPASGSQLGLGPGDARNEARGPVGPAADGLALAALGPPDRPRRGSDPDSGTMDEPGVDLPQCLGQRDIFEAGEGNEAAHPAVHAAGVRAKLAPPWKSCRGNGSSGLGSRSASSSRRSRRCTRSCQYARRTRGPSARRATGSTPMTPATASAPAATSARVAASQPAATRVSASVEAIKPCGRPTDSRRAQARSIRHFRAVPTCAWPAANDRSIDPDDDTRSRLDGPTTGDLGRPIRAVVGQDDHLERPGVERPTPAVELTGEGGQGRRQLGFLVAGRDDDASSELAVGFGEAGPGMLRDHGQTFRSGGGLSSGGPKIAAQYGSSDARLVTATRRNRSHRRRWSLAGRGVAGILVTHDPRRPPVSRPSQPPHDDPRIGASTLMSMPIDP